MRIWAVNAVLLAALIAVVAAAGGVFGGPEADPAYAGELASSDAVSLDEALALAADTGRPVVVTVTASWCPPCQVLKRTALSDSRVTGWLDDRAVYVSLDADAQRADAARLGVRVLPTTMMLVDGEAVSGFEGAVGADQFLAWARGAAPDADGEQTEAVGEPEADARAG